MWQTIWEISTPILLLVNIGLQGVVIFRLVQMSRKHEQSKEKTEGFLTLVTALEEDRRALQEKGSVLHEYEEKLRAIEVEKEIQRAAIAEILNESRTGTRVFTDAPAEWYESRENNA